MEFSRLGKAGVGGSEEDEIFSRKSKFLDVQSLYKSRSLKEGKCGGKVRVKENGEHSKGKKRSKSNSSRAEGSEGKKSRTSENGAVRSRSVDLNDKVVTTLSRSQDSVSAFVGVSLSLDTSGNFFRIPKRPRGSARRKRFEIDSGSKLPEALDGLNDEVKKVEVHRVSMFPDSSVASASDQPAGELRCSSAGNAAMQNVKSEASSIEHKENGTVSAQNYKDKLGPHVIHDDDTSIKRRPNRRKRKCFPSRSRTTAEKIESPVGESGSMCTHSPNDDDDEENLEQNAARMLSSRFDPSCTGFSTKSRYSVSPDTNGFSYMIPSAYRDMNSVTGSESPSVDNSSRILRPRKQHSKKGLSRKRRHYYEIVPRGMDAHWVLNRKIKVFWPLDKSWYYGLVSDYDPERKVHHIKYDDRDEEWVDLQGEKFKLLLLPDEVPVKIGHIRSVGVAVADKMSAKFDDNDRPTKNNLDSEPIITWMSRSSHQVKQPPSSPLKKEKLLGPQTSTRHDNYHNAKENGHLFVRHGSDESGGLTLCSSLDDDCLRTETSECSEVRKLVVYHRKRHRNDGGTPKAPAKGSYCDQNLWLLDDNGFLQLSKRVLESAGFRFDTCLSLLALHQKLLGRDQTWLSNTLFLSQYGTMVSRWPIFALEILIVDNIIGMRSLLFEGSLDHVSAIVFLILSVFIRHGEDCLVVEPQLPATSIRISLSCVKNPRKKNLFAFFNFSKWKSSKRLHLDSELRCQSILTKKLPMSECTYENIKAFEGGNYQCDALCAGPKQLDLQKITKQCMVPICRSIESCSSKMGRAAFSLAATPGKLLPFAVSFAAAPTFFLNLHLNMLMRCNFACISLEDGVSSKDTERDTLVKPDFCRALSLSRKDTGTNSVSNVGSCSCAAASAGCLTSVLPHSGKDDMRATDIGVSTLSPQGPANSKVDLAGSSTSSPKNQKNATEAAIVPDECELDYLHVPVVATSHLPTMKSSIPHGGFSSVGEMSVEVSSIDQVDRSPDERMCLLGQPFVLNADIGHGRSPNYTGPRSSLQTNQSSISPFQDLSPVWRDGKTNMVNDVFSNGPKKPRTQVQYTMSYGGNDLCSKQKLHQRSLPYKRIRRADERRNSNGSRSSQRNLKFSSCGANVLVTSGDKGWRDMGANVVLELADHNEWRLAIRISGVTKYSCKVNNILQWSTNRYTHAMMWKGGKDWALEFPDRDQWLLFKEIHEECHDRNIRASSVKHIPIPGVRLIEDSDDYVNSMPFVRHPSKYFKQVEDDVGMAMNPTRVLYDMDSEDELWLSGNKSPACSKNENYGDISDELFEKTMDMFEKVAHAEKRDQFSVDEIDELAVGLGSTGVVKHIYEHWLQKRRRKDISLIRHLQPPLWEQYQQQLKEWEQAVAKANSAVSSACQERPVPKEKPPMFAFCLRPRGLEIVNKGSKHRSHKKLSVSGHNHTDLDGRRSNGVAFGEERILFSGNGPDASEASPLLRASSRGYSPRDASGFGCFSLGNDGPELNHPTVAHRVKTRKVVGGSSNTPTSVASHNQKTIGRRNGIHRWTTDVAEWPSHGYYQPEVSFMHNSPHFNGSDVQEFRLHDVSGAAQHAQKLAKMKRERAQKLMFRADMAIHKAVVAIMTAEAMKVATENSNCDG